jgi:hypothetical protein
MPKSLFSGVFAALMVCARASHSRVGGTPIYTPFVNIIITINTNNNNNLEMGCDGNGWGYDAKGCWA